MHANKISYLKSKEFISICEPWMHMGTSDLLYMHV